MLIKTDLRTAVLSQTSSLAAVSSSTKGKVQNQGKLVVKGPPLLPAVGSLCMLDLAVVSWCLGKASSFPSWCLGKASSFPWECTSVAGVVCSQQGAGADIAPQGKARRV